MEYQLVYASEKFNDVPSVDSERCERQECWRVSFGEEYGMREVQYDN